MSCRPLRWLWGLLPLALIGLMVNYFARPVIEADLKRRGEIALKGAGLPWAGMAFEGRDGVLSGMAFDEGARAKAIKTVADIFGVRIVDDRASLVEMVEKYYWLAARENSRIRLKGYVPNEEIRKTVIGMAAASFPGHEIDDRMRPARGAPPEDSWLSGVNFAFKQLGHLNKGRARLDATHFTIVGEARDIKAFNQLDHALSSNVPRGITVKVRNIIAPKVSPFTWSAVIRNGKLVMSGHVPSEEARGKLIADAKAKFPGRQAVDQLNIARGAPSGWIKGSVAALAALSRLGNGQATMSDASLNIIGSTKQRSVPRAIGELLQSELPKSFTKKIDIVLIETTPPKLDWRALLKSNSIILEGDVPDRATQTLLIKHARQQFPGKRVINRMNIKSVTAPEGWSDTATRALGAMTVLSEGEATLNNTTLRISGTARTKPGIAIVRETVTSYMPHGYQGYEFVKPPAQTYNHYSFTDVEEDSDNWWRSYLAGLKKKAQKPVVDVEKIMASKKPIAADVCSGVLNKLARTGIVRFETNSARIQSLSYPTLDKIVSVARKCPSVAFEVSGHTDSDGSDSYNKKLSLRRAKSIVAYMATRGITNTRMKSAGYGETRPIAANDTALNKARNRRIEFKVLSN